jgi:hypothetical protein
MDYVSKIDMKEEEIATKKKDIRKEENKIKDNELNELKKELELFTAEKKT